MLISTASVLLIGSLGWVAVAAINQSRRVQALNSKMQGAIGWGKLSRIRQLLDQGADPRCRDSGGKTIAMVAAEYGDLPLLERALQHVVDINQTDAGGGTVLFHAVHRRAQIALIKAVLSRGADPNCASVSGYTPLHLAVIDDHESALRALLAAGANINAQKDNGPTPLYVAVDGNNLRMVQVLLARGADPRQKCNGQTVLSRSIHKRDDALRRMGLAYAQYHIDVNNLNIVRIPQLLDQGTRRRYGSSP